MQMREAQALLQAQAAAFQQDMQAAQAEHAQVHLDPRFNFVLSITVYMTLHSSFSVLCSS